jgi:hypothetical protein
MEFRGLLGGVGGECWLVVLMMRGLLGGVDDAWTIGWC